jgi:hypothetical protein
VRPKTQRDLTAAVTQALRCEAVGAVLGWCERLSALEARQFQLAAETGGGLGLLLRPAAILATPSFATVRLVVTPAASVNFFRRLHVEVVRHHGGATGQSLLLELDDETGHVRVPAEVAVAKTVSRAARASG